MHPTEFTESDPMGTKDNYKVVRSDSLKDVPGRIVSASVMTGDCNLCDVNGVSTKYSFGPHGIVILPRK